MGSIWVAIKYQDKLLKKCKYFEKQNAHGCFLKCLMSFLCFLKTLPHKLKNMLKVFIQVLAHVKALYNFSVLLSFWKVHHRLLWLLELGVKFDQAKS
jgi:hypothetical protein